MFGKITWWAPPTAKNRGYGFIEVRHADNHLEKFFCLGSRLLTDVHPVAGMDCEFEPAEAPRDPQRQYQLATKIRILTVAPEKNAEETYDRDAGIAALQTEVK
jgi:hypothetical protein